MFEKGRGEGGKEVRRQEGWDRHVSRKNEDGS